MKKRMLLALMMLSLVIFAGCGKEEEAVSDKNENKTEISTGNKEQEMPKAEAGIADAEGIVFDNTENTETENAESVTSEEENADAVEKDVQGETSKNIESEKDEPKKEESKNEKPEKEESKKEESKKEEPKKEESKKEEGSKGDGNGVPVAPSQDEEETGLVEPEGPKSEEPEGPKTEEPESPKTENPESPKTENQEGKPETTPSTEDENEDVAAEEMTYEEFQSMSPADQQKYMESFDDIAAFFDWYNRVKTEYEKENPPILLEGNEIDLSDYLRGE